MSSSTGITRTLRKAVATVALGSGLALAVSPALAQAAQALPVSSGGTSTTRLCYWDGKAYSAGAKKEFNGDIYTCQSDGSWKKDGRNHPALTATYQAYAR